MFTQAIDNISLKIPYSHREVKDGKSRYHSLKRKVGLHTQID